MLIKNIQQQITSRRSIRNYILKKVDNKTVHELDEFIKTQNTGPFGETIDFRIIEVELKDNKQMKLNYGMIKNNRNYILGVTDNNKVSRISYGFLMEMIVLKATELGLGTCWIGVFDPEYFSYLNIPDGKVIPSLVIFGYEDKGFSLVDKITRYAVKATKRKDKEELFFSGDFSTKLTGNEAGDYDFPLEMLRLAPSAGNTQPWRILKEKHNNNFHFFKKPVSESYEAKGLHDVDLGICSSHFQLAAESKGLKGKWQIIEELPLNIPPEISYSHSWIES
jgi:nitroreductase